MNTGKNFSYVDKHKTSRCSFQNGLRIFLFPKELVIVRSCSDDVCVLNVIDNQSNGKYKDE